MACWRVRFEPRPSAPSAATSTTPLSLCRRCLATINSIAPPQSATFLTLSAHSQTLRSKASKLATSPATKNSQRRHAHRCENARKQLEAAGAELVPVDTHNAVAIIHPRHRRAPSNLSLRWRSLRLPSAKTLKTSKTSQPLTQRRFWRRSQTAHYAGHIRSRAGC